MVLFILFSISSCFYIFFFIPVDDNVGKLMDKFEFFGGEIGKINQKFEVLGGEIGKINQKLCKFYYIIIFIFFL